MHRVFLDIGSQRTPSYAECAGEWDVRAIDVIFVEEKDCLLYTSDAADE